MVIHKTVSPSPLQSIFQTETLPALAERALRMVNEETFRRERVWTPVPPTVREQVLEQLLPERGLDAERILQLFQELILPYEGGNRHPRFAAWIIPPPEPLGVIGELLTAVINLNAGVGDHIAPILERHVLDWLKEVLDLRPWTDYHGILTSGSTTASTTCLAAARYWAAEQQGWNIRDDGFQSSHAPLVVYASEQAHSSLQKALEELGFGSRYYRRITVNEGYQIDLAALRHAIAADRAAGLIPSIVIATTGTVNTGAIDPLGNLADLCEEEGLWLHIDGAYGAFGRFHPELADHYQGMERAHSLALDAHKMLCVPIECGVALVREGNFLHKNYSLVPEYLHASGIAWQSEYGLQLSRSFRALKLWMTMLHYGQSGLELLVKHQCALGSQMASRIQHDPDFALVAGGLSICCFRYQPAAQTPAFLDTLNRVLPDQVQERGRAFLSGTWLDRPVLRACFVHPLSTVQDIEAIIEEVRFCGMQVQRESACPSRLHQADA